MFKTSTSFLWHARQRSTALWRQALPLRSFLLHEYQAAQVMHRYRVPIPKGQVAFNSQEAFNIARTFGADYAPRQFVVKAQVKTEGRTTGYFKETAFHGGVHTVQSISEVRDIAQKMLGKMYVGEGTDGEGIIVNCVYIQEQLDIETEIYLQIKLDPKTQQPIIIYSRHGGMSLERIMRLHPNSIHTIPIDYIKGLAFSDLLKVSRHLGLPDCESKLAFLIKNCYECFVQRDCFDLLINPLVWTKCHKFRAANPRMEIDENSLYRQAEILSLIDNAQINTLERIATFNELRYRKLNGQEGNIGLITNGKGMSMATLDLIEQLHGKPANYLDFTVSSSIEDILYALDLMQYDERVKVVLINIFGGGLEIQRIAEGIMVARSHGVIEKPIVVRLKGVFEKEANQMLYQAVSEQVQDDGIAIAPLHLEIEFEMAALQAVKIAAEAELSELVQIQQKLHRIEQQRKCE